MYFRVLVPCLVAAVTRPFVRSFVPFWTRSFFPIFCFYVIVCVCGITCMSSLLASCVPCMADIDIVNERERPLLGMTTLSDHFGIDDYNDDNDELSWNRCAHREWSALLSLRPGESESRKRQTLPKMDSNDSFFRYRSEACRKISRIREAIEEERGRECKGATEKKKTRRIFAFTIFPAGGWWLLKNCLVPPNDIPPVPVGRFMHGFGKLLAYVSECAHCSTDIW